MPRTEIRIAGFGGQGVVLAGVIIGRAATGFDGRHAAQTQSYGAEARGGQARSEVVISDQPVDYPKVSKSDILVGMSQEALTRHIGQAKEGSVILADADLAADVPDAAKFKVYKVPFTRIAQEELGRRIVANIVMLGALVGATGVVSMDALRKATKESVPERALELNMKALDRGFQIASELKSKAA